MCCEQERKDKIIPVEEHKKRFVIDNPNQIKVNQVKVDGCLINDETMLKCDYLFEIDSPTKIVKYVELKGKDIKHAFDQLCSTINHLKTRHSDRKKYCYIVAQRYPKSGPASQVFKKRMRQQHNALLEIKTTSHTVKI